MVGFWLVGICWGTFIIAINNITFIIIAIVIFTSASSSSSPSLSSPPSQDHQCMSAIIQRFYICQGEHYVGSVVRGTCNPGFVLVGEPVIRCTQVCTEKIFLNIFVGTHFSKVQNLTSEVWTTRRGCGHTTLQNATEPAGATIQRSQKILIVRKYCKYLNCSCSEVLQASSIQIPWNSSRWGDNPCQVSLQCRRHHKVDNIHRISFDAF